MRHCGKNKLQLVISRRNPKLLNSKVAPDDYPKNDNDDAWGFTIVRREPNTENRKVPTLTYLAPIEADKKPRKGEILSFEADTMPLFPEGHDPYKKEVESGTLIKLYDYNLSNTGHILRRNGLLYKWICSYLIQPFRFLCMSAALELGKGEVRTQETPMSGMLSRLRDNKISKKLSQMRSN